jgi:hypothetical protein
LVQKKKPSGRKGLRLDPLAKESYKELLSFLRYFRHFGTPTIIGGWAVYFYNPYFGSVDVDVVGPSFGGEFYDVIERYERSHGYSVVQNDPLGIEVVASKPIYGKMIKKIGDMEIDACSFEQISAGIFHEAKTKSLPYSLCGKESNRGEVRIAKNSVCYVPSRALLALFKIKARRDRSYDFRTKAATMNAQRLEWLRGKIVKDGSDIIALLDDGYRKGALLDRRFASDQFRKIASEEGLTRFAKETVQDVLIDESAISRYGRSINSKSLLEKLMI